jgi:uncharacterized membrane protein
VENGGVQAQVSRLVSAAGLAWAGLLALAPAAPAALAGAVYAAASLVCHQQPERSFHAWGAQLPVCARCAGIYAGAAVVALAFLTGVWTPGVRGSRASTRGVLIAGCAPTLATVVLEWSGFWAVPNAIRAAAGLMLGAAAAAVVIAELHWMPRDAAGPLAPTRS